MGKALFPPLLQTDPTGVTLFGKSQSIHCLLLVLLLLYAPNMTVLVVPFLTAQCTHMVMCVYVRSRADCHFSTPSPLSAVIYPLPPPPNQPRRSQPRNGRRWNHFSFSLSLSFLFLRRIIARAYAKAPRKRDSPMFTHRGQT